MNIRKFLPLAIITLFSQCIFSSMASAEQTKENNTCKEGNYLQGILSYKHKVQSGSAYTTSKLELASCYFMAGYFEKGSRVFKSIIDDKSVASNIKINISKYIEEYKAAINNRLKTKSSLDNLLRSQDSTNLIVVNIYQLLQSDPNFHKMRLTLIHLLIKLGRADEAFDQLSRINKHQLDEIDNSQFSILSEIVKNKFKNRSYASGKAALTIGYDNNISGTASNDFYEDDDFFNSEKIDGGYAQLYGSLQYNLINPIISQGEYSHSNLNIFNISIHDRSFFNDEGESRNYNIQDIGYTFARKSNNNTQLLLPISIKNIKLNEESYARYLDFKLRYSWDIDGVKLSISERLSHRDYQQFNEDRQNANLSESAFQIGFPLTKQLKLNSRINYTLLDTIDEEFRSYSRFTYGISSTYTTNAQTAFTAGFRYQTTSYRGLNTLLQEPCFEEDEDLCEDDNLIYDFIREDDLNHIYLETNTKLNKDWNLKFKWNLTDRESNQDRYTYSRRTLSLGIYGKF